MGGDKDPLIPNLGAVSSNLAGDATCNTWLKNGAARWGTAPFSL